MAYSRGLAWKESLEKMKTEIANTEEKLNKEHPNRIAIGTKLDWKLPQYSKLKTISFGDTELPKEMTSTLYSKGVYNYEDFVEKYVKQYTKEEWEREENLKREKEEKQRQWELKQKEIKHKENVKQIKEDWDLPYLYENWKFDKLDKEFIDNNKDVIKLIKNYLKRDILTLEDKIGKSLYFYGNCGTGKTTLLACLMNEFAEREIPVMFMPSVNLIAKYIDEDKTSKNQILNTRILFIDDLSKQTMNYSFASILYEIVDTRMSNGFLTFWTNNIPLKQTFTQYKSKNKADLETLCALYSRISSSVVECPVKGISMRKTMTFESLSKILEEEENENIYRNR